jgi:hypothetical protein
MTQTSSSPVWSLQVAIRGLLLADAQLVALLDGQQAVYDQVPEGDPYPFIRIGDTLSIPDNTHTTFGREVTETLHVWTRVRGNHDGQAIATRVGELLDYSTAALNARLAALDPPRHKVVTIRQEFDQALTDPDPEIRHHVLRFRVQTTRA